MNPEPLPRIPAPARVWWREVRVRVGPPVFLAALLAAIALLWSRGQLGRTVNGVGEGVRALVTSPQPGWLVELKVRPYQLVNAGEVVAVIRPADPRVPLELLRLELEVARLRFQPSLAEQNAMNYEQVRSDLFRLQAELAVARVNLERARNEAERNTPLYQEQLVSEDLYDLSLKTRDAFAAEVTAKTQAVQAMERRLEALQTIGDPQVSSADARLEALVGRLDAAQTSAATEWGPIPLRAPVSGMVSGIHRQQGEYVVEGEPLVAVHSLWSDRVIGYLRQPYPVDPEIGQPVKITTRNSPRVQFWSSISQVGAQVDVITNALAYVRQGMLVDVGLPIVIGLPRECRIRPGEIVDLWIQPSGARPETGRESHLTLP